MPVVVNGLSISLWAQMNNFRAGLAVHWRRVDAQKITLIMVVSNQHIMRVR